jgi:hypothetical protein
MRTFFFTSTANHNTGTRQRNNLYLPQANLTIYQKGAYYVGIKIFNNLPLKIKNVVGNQKKFKITLKKIFVQWKCTVVNRELHTDHKIAYCITKLHTASQNCILYHKIAYCITKLHTVSQNCILYHKITYIVLSFYLYTLYKYLRIFYYELIIFPCIIIIIIIIIIYFIFQV